MIIGSDSILRSLLLQLPLLLKSSASGESMPHTATSTRPCDASDSITPSRYERPHAWVVLLVQTCS